MARGQIASLCNQRALSACSAVKSPRPFALSATSAAALLLLASSVAVPLDSWAAPFASGNFVAYRVGAETGARSVYLDEYSADGTLVQSVALSSTVAASLAAYEGRNAQKRFDVSDNLAQTVNVLW